MHSVYCSLAPTLCPAHSWSEPLASTTSFLATLISYFPQILLKTFPTSIGLATPLHSSSGIRRLATRGAMVKDQSISCLHRVLGIVAIASHSLVNDCLRDLQAIIFLKPFALTPDGSPAPCVLKAACLTISLLISVYTDSR